MPEPRVPMLPLEESRKRAADLGLNPQFAELSVFRILLHNQPVAGEIARTLTTLLFDGNVLDARLRELIIMRIGWQTGATYEWTQHWRVARGMDIPAEDLLNLFLSSDGCRVPGVDVSEIGLEGRRPDEQEDRCQDRHQKRERKGQPRMPHGQSGRRPEAQ